MLCQIIQFIQTQITCISVLLGTRHQSNTFAVINPFFANGCVLLVCFHSNIGLKTSLNARKIGLRAGAG